MSRMRYSSNTPKKRPYILFIFIFIALIIITAGIASYANGSSTQSYLKRVEVVEGKIGNIESDEEGSVYVRVDIPETTKIDGLYDRKNLWVQVTDEFYRSNNVGNNVGILLGEYDVYKKKYWGLFGDMGQNFENSEWGIEEIYNSYYTALQNNPHRITTEKVVITKKKTTKSGENFIVVKSGERSFKYKVDINTFNKYQVGQQIECQFESTGDFVKLLKVI